MRTYTTSLTFATTLDALRYEDALFLAASQAMGSGESLTFTHRRAGEHGETVYLTADTPRRFLDLPEAAGALRREGMF